MRWAIRGLIEGFYGRPWTWDERILVARWCAERGMTHYVHAPKDDERHRVRWRNRWPPEELDGFARLVAEGGLAVGVGLSPGLSIDYGSAAEREALWSKVAPVLDEGATMVALCLDDIPVRPGLGPDQAELCTWLHDRLAGAATLVLVPTEYLGSRPTPYLDALAAGLPDDVPVAWTGTSVVNDTISAEEAAGRAAALGGRAPLVWDNAPVNDAIMADRLFLGPLRGRDPGLAEACSGYLANPMVQPRASLLPLASTAAWLRGDDPEAAWAEEADALGWRVLAEGCDGDVLGRLVDRLDADADADAGPLRAWLDAAAHCEAPGLEEEAGPWLEQLRAEAKVGRVALRLHEAATAGDAEAVLAHAFQLMFRWPAVRRSPTSVLGPRCGFRPALGQRPDGVWTLLPGVLEEDGNALDALVRLALARSTAPAPPG